MIAVTVQHNKNMLLFTRAVLKDSNSFSAQGWKNRPFFFVSQLSRPFASYIMAMGGVAVSILPEQKFTSLP
jgi:hypothetical protein